jgi:HK97 family phage major capsid protein
MSELLQEVKSAVVSTINEITPELISKIKENIIQELGENKLKNAPKIKDDDDWRVRTLKILNAFNKHDLAQVRALTTSGAPGWVPEEFSKRVVEVIGLENPYRQFGTVLPVTYLKGNVPRFLSSITVSRIGESASYPESSLSPDKVTYSIEKWGALVGLTEELMDLSNPNIVDVLIRAVGRAFADKERDLFTNGTGTNQPKGIRSETYSSAITFSDADSVIQAYYTVDPQYRAKAVWLTSSKGVLVLRKLKDAQGRYLWQDGFGETPATILGRPVYEIPEIPSNLGAGNDETEIYFGDFSYYYIFDYGTLESSENDVLGWKEDVFYLKFRKYFDGKMAYFAEGVNVVKISAVK